MNVQNTLDKLAQDGFCLIDNFLDPNVAQSLRAQAETMRQNAAFAKARVGQRQSLQRAESLRRDKILWLDAPGQCTIEQQHYQTKVWEYATASNNRFFLGIQEFECHFALYEAGDFYQKHRDVFHNNKRRKLSCVYYLNPDWLPGDGGELVLYDDNGGELQRISPLFNRFILFDSEIIHEVLATNKLRYSITGWFKTAL